MPRASVLYGRVNALCTVPCNIPATFYAMLLDTYGGKLLASYPAIDQLPDRDKLNTWYTVRKNKPKFPRITYFSASTLFLHIYIFTEG